MKYTISSYSDRNRADLAYALQTFLIRLADYIGLASFVIAALLSLRGISIFLGATISDNIIMKGFLSLTGLVVNPFKGLFNYEITIVEVNTALAVVTILIVNIIFQKIVRTVIGAKALLDTDDNAATA